MHYSKLSQKELDEILDMNLEDFGVNPHVAGVLDNNGIYSVRGLLGTTKDKLMKMNGLNTRSINGLLSLLRLRGFY